MLANWWAEVVKPTHTRLYIGVALYKVGEPSKNEPDWTVDGGVPELKKQLDLNETLPQIQAPSCSAKTTSISRKPGRRLTICAAAGAAAEPAASRLCYSACSPCCRRACSFSMFSVMACQTWLEKSAGSRPLSIACGTCPANSEDRQHLLPGKVHRFGRRQKMTRIDGVNLCFTPFVALSPIDSFRSRSPVPPSTGNAEIMS